MFSVLLIVLPIFALIAAGWAERVTGFLGPRTCGELNRFVVWLAFPMLLFDIVAKARWSEIWQPGFIAVFGLGMAAAFALTVWARWRSSRHLADAAVDGLNAAYGNTGFIGFPLAASVIGPAGMAPTLIATILTVGILFAVAMVLIEVGVQTERNARRMLPKVARALATNPLLVAPALGGVFLAFAIPIPAPMDHFLTLLGGAASPCALVALGLFIAEKRPGDDPSAGEVGILTAIKLLAQPAITWLLATQVFALSASMTAIAVLMAMLPTGTGPFMIAEVYHREAAITARVVLASTIASIVTITAYLSLT